MTCTYACLCAYILRYALFSTLIHHDLLFHCIPEEKEMDQTYAKTPPSLFPLPLSFPRSRALFSLLLSPPLPSLPPLLSHEPVINHTVVV